MNDIKVLVKPEKEVLQREVEAYCESNYSCSSSGVSCYDYSCSSYGVTSAGDADEDILF